MKDASGKNAVDWAFFAVERRRKRNPSLDYDKEEQVMRILQDAWEKEEEEKENPCESRVATDMCEGGETADGDEVVTEDGVMYDYYVMQAFDHVSEKEIIMATAPVVSIEQDFDDVEGITRGLEDEVWGYENGAFDSDAEDSDFDEDDSNEEDYYANDYPDESEHGSDNEKVFVDEDDDEAYEEIDRGNMYAGSCNDSDEDEDADYY